MIVENMKDRIMTSCRLLSLFATYLGIFSIALCQSTCPTRCLCHLDQQPRTVTCSQQGLEIFPENISDMVEQLNLSNNLLTNITVSDVNRLIDLQYLNLARNKLSSLPEDISFLKSLKRLDLSDNKIYDVIDINSVRQLPSLLVLHLSRNPLSSLEGLISANITVLDASHCGIRELSNTSLDGLKALTTLSLAGNPLKLIQKVWSPKLRWLDMSDCRLNYLGPDTFSGLPELLELQLSNNPTLVYSTRHTTLKHLKLKKLDVSRCNLDRPGLHGLPSLTHARLSHNIIRMLPDRIFAKNRELSFLYLNTNAIENLNASAFEGLVKLQVLDLSVNNLDMIHPLIFHENVELKLLNLSYNTLHEFPNLTSAVTSLDASSNEISNMNGNFLANMPKVRSINFSDNRLERIPPGLKSTTLRNLDLRRNRIVDVHKDTFLHLPQLIRIDLSGNRLTGAIDPMIFRNNPDINTIKLEDNPWRCDCKELLFMYSFLTEPPAKTFEQSLLCQTPANVSGYTWITACFDAWNEPLYYNKDRTWGFVMIALLMMVVLFGSFVSIRHMMRIKRRALEQRQQLETLRLLRQRRTQAAQEEHVERVPEPRIHPLELVGPPSYEEAIQMPRLARSLDNLDEISVEMSTTRIMGSVDNIRVKRRTRRPKKRIQSEDDLLRRGERRQERIRRERNSSAGNSGTDLPLSQRNSKVYAARRARRQSVISDSMDSASGRTRSRPQTPSTRKKKRRYTVYDGHSTDDEDSDIQPVGSSRSIVIRELRREPKGGYRESTTEREF
ncbi:PREDICTED: insulin-like growth factor-binding protein complex acid labile subunit [Habropoda laboriosa]|uniref:insulin-like growth factor-binding protein complex acid labile subunit n=1 Tax=Habropoda laboriosa TaxID=597456 RepID=UPI00083CE14D|nr:PREDICTED: insulin-like growth factor-binding protein complex acid labile subunit [Habropoda laboriosa]